MKLAALALAGLLLYAVAARADGDPASDFLYTRETFVPYDLRVDAQAKRDFVATVRDANKAHFNIRVAVIGNAFDLGAELAVVYRQRLLIVMPNGFGFFWKGHTTTDEYASLQRIRIAPGATGLVVAARDAVQELAG